MTAQLSRQCQRFATMRSAAGTSVQVVSQKTAGALPAPQGVSSRLSPSRGGPMEISIHNGRPCVNRDGLAELTGRSRQTIDLWASPLHRRPGFPDHVRITRPGGAWYPIEDAQRFAEQVNAEDEAARPQPVFAMGNPDRLIDGTEFRELMGITKNTWDSYVHKSKPAWENGADGVLPYPAGPDHIHAGKRRRWRLGTAVEFLNNRTSEKTINRRS